ncbi:unnamed protein product [Mycetohabitans rhizoxinica HKI 454]|uniref:Uncharacterized protein n=1 Tax=Mycetohabitans rhizoxinica (strain DSM 19002 / CIP 109453 / HKI 454) TaxID=882378 RepID=E5ARB0_MYCRK|nr:unnamed protein product [Mycetohabitans rhizoxinica HKI 454]
MSNAASCVPGGVGAAANITACFAAPRAGGAFHESGGR